MSNLPHFCRHRSAALILILLVLLAGIDLHQRSSAQEEQTGREVAFAKKADKLLKRVRNAVQEDRSAERKSTFQKSASQLNRLARLAGVQRFDNKFFVDVAVVLTRETDEDLKAAGFAIAARIGNVATLQVDVDLF